MYTMVFVQNGQLAIVRVMDTASQNLRGIAYIFVWNIHYIPCLLNLLLIVNINMCLFKTILEQKKESAWFSRFIAETFDYPTFSSEFFVRLFSIVPQELSRVSDSLI